MKFVTTGHRPNKLNKEWNGVGPVSDYIRANFLLHITRLNGDLGEHEGVCGMALGVDILFAELILELGWKLTAAIPCEGQELAWPAHSQERYHRVLNNPLTTKHIVSSGGYAAWKMQTRNEWMIDVMKPEDYLLGVWDGTPGGTSNCLQYARKKLKEDKIIIINPKLLAL